VFCGTGEDFVTVDQFDDVAASCEDGEIFRTARAQR
jgi:hypothetical protein